MKESQDKTAELKKMNILRLLIYLIQNGLLESLRLFTLSPAEYEGSA